MAWLLTAAMMAGNSSFPVLAQEMPEIMLIDEENLSDSIPASGSEAAHSHDSIEIEGISTVADPGLTEAGLESESETESETEDRKPRLRLRPRQEPRPKPRQRPRSGQKQRQKPRLGQSWK